MCLCWPFFANTDFNLVFSKVFSIIQLRNKTMKMQEFLNRDIIYNQGKNAIGAIKRSERKRNRDNPNFLQNSEQNRAKCPASNVIRLTFCSVFFVIRGTFSHRLRSGSSSNHYVT